MEKICNVLKKGERNAIPGKELALYLGCDIRTVVAMIEQERRDGQPICANPTGTNTGYYLAESNEELKAYCERLAHREKELRTTRTALTRILNRIAEQKGGEHGEADTN